MAELRALAAGAVAEATAFMHRVLTARETESRLPCSAGEGSLGNILLHEWSAAGFATGRHTFTCQPRAFLGVIPVCALLCLASIRMFNRRPRFSLAAAAAASCLLYFEVIRYREFVEPFALFSEKAGTNVFARIAPRSGKADRRLVVTAHMDVALEFNLYRWFKAFAAPVMLLGMAAPLVLLVGGLLQFPRGSKAARRARSVFYGVSVFLAIPLAPFVAFESGRAVPGAMDNLSAVAVMRAFGRQLAARPPAGRPWVLSALDSTEVVLLGMSSEEAGLRGAKRYVDSFRDELRELPTAVVVLECAADPSHLHVLSREDFCSANHSPELVALAQAAAADVGLPLPAKSLPLGATDATAFTQAGFHAVTLQAVDLSSLPPNYHTMLDTMEFVQPEALERVLTVVLALAARFGAGTQEAALRQFAAGDMGERGVQQPGASSRDHQQQQPAAGDSSAGETSKRSAASTTKPAAAGGADEDGPVLGRAVLKSEPPPAPAAATTAGSLLGTAASAGRNAAPGAAGAEQLRGGIEKSAQQTAAAAGAEKQQLSGVSTTTTASSGTTPTAKQDEL